MDVANYCGNISNCILALKRIKTEFPSLCLRTVWGTHSGILDQCRDACPELARGGLPAAVPAEVGLQVVRKRASGLGVQEYRWVGRVTGKRVTGQAAISCRPYEEDSEPPAPPAMM